MDSEDIEQGMYGIMIGNTWNIVGMNYGGAENKMIAIPTFAMKSHWIWLGGKFHGIKSHKQCCFK